MCELIEGVEFKFVLKEKFVVMLQYVYVCEMDWQIEWGGFQVDELCRNCVQMQGFVEDDEKIDEVIEIIQIQWGYVIDIFVSDEICKCFFKYIMKMFVGEWEDVWD